MEVKKLIDWMKKDLKSQYMTPSNTWELGNCKQYTKKNFEDGLQFVLDYIENLEQGE